MNITFLIGNGFDRNLGLETMYSDFVKIYKNITPDNDILKNFKEHIDTNQELWSNAEIALGQYTKEFEKGKAADLAICQIDFCDKLADYLRKEDAKVSYEKSEDAIKTIFNNMKNLSSDFLPEEKAAIDNIYQKYPSSGVSFAFINYNYTYTLDRCYEKLKEVSNHNEPKISNNILKNRIGELCHVHGTIDGDMVFAVNDEKQIANNDIFDCEDGDLYKSFLIKQQSNKLYLQRTDSKANNMLNDSRIIYIYGMSLGETDKLWWDRICDWLVRNKDNHVIIYKHNMPAKTVLPIYYQLHERKEKRKLLLYSKYTDEVNEELLNRIHITTKDIFEPIKNIGKITRTDVLDNAVKTELSNDAGGVAVITDSFENIGKAIEKELSQI